MTRVHDVAAEFGISSEQLMGLLEGLDIFVRSARPPAEGPPAELATGAAPAAQASLPLAAAFGAGLGAAPPRPVIPTPVRPKPVASAAPGGPVPPRPVASAAPGTMPLEERRRDKRKKRKKGKKSLVDQEALAQNISRTLASLKRPRARKGGHPRDAGT